MTNGRKLLALALAGLALLAGCREEETGPLTISAIGKPPRLVNPNLQPLDPPSALLSEAVAQGLVRFDAAGQVEPALAQSWILSDDGLRYTFRIARAQWADGKRVTAEEVTGRLRAASSRSSRNPLKPLLGAIEEVEAMTENVLEITLKAPRPNFLQLLAQPEMAIVRNGAGTGPYRSEALPGGAVRLTPPAGDDEEDRPAAPPIILRGDRAAMAVVRFGRNLSDFVTGGTVGDLPIVRASATPTASLRFDPAAGLFGLVFTARDGPVADPAVRRALSMAVDRDALVASLGVPGLAPRTSILPLGIDELPAPALPDWAGSPLPARRALASRTIASLARDTPPTIRVALPAGPGYRLVFAHLRRDWRLIGVTAEAVRPDAVADLMLIDAVAAANLSTWYLRRFGCAQSAVCSPEAEALLEAARLAPSAGERQVRLAEADRMLTDLTPFIPIAAPVRWSLVSPRLTGFQPNPFARHFVGSLIADRR